MIVIIIDIAASVELTRLSEVTVEEVTSKCGLFVGKIDLMFFVLSYFFVFIIKFVFGDDFVLTLRCTESSP